MIYLIHFAFFLKIYKKSENKKKLQEIYDYNFRQLELSIREIGYGGVSINKKMKDYLNTFHKIILEIDGWERLNHSEKSNFFANFIGKSINLQYFVDYFDKFEKFLKNNTLNSFINNILKFDI